MNDDEKSFSRREFFGQSFGWLRKAAAEYVESQISASRLKNFDAKTHLLPPGAKKPLDEFLKACTRCGDCITACHQHSIFKAPENSGPLAGFPVIDPKKRPCFLCTDLPCIPSCKDGALLPLAVKEVRLGLAVIDNKRCVAHTRGQNCRYCVNACPYPNEAIRHNGGKPEIVEDACTGCGLCVYECKEKAEDCIQIIPDYETKG